MIEYKRIFIQYIGFLLLTEKWITTWEQKHRVYVDRLGSLILYKNRVGLPI